MLPRYSIYFKYGWLVWIASSVVQAVGFIVLAHFAKWTPSLSQRYFGYNNPMVVLGSLGIFTMFTKIKIQNTMINNLAKGVFGIFLLHTTSIFIYYRSSIVGHLYNIYGYVAVLLSALVIFVVCALVALFVEYAKQPLYKILRIK